MIEGIYDTKEDAEAGVNSLIPPMPVDQFLKTLFPKSRSFYQRREFWCAWLGHWEKRVTGNAYRCRRCHAWTRRHPK